MTTLTKSDKAALIHKVLFDAFDHRFLALNKEIRQSVQQALAKDHPKFLSLRANEDVKKYIACNHATRFVVNSLSGAGRPMIVVKPVNYSSDFTHQITAQSSSNYYLKELNAEIIGSIDIIVPLMVGIGVSINQEMEDKYYAIHSDLEAATTKLSALLGAYRLREKFEKDFPELAVFLPAIPVKIAMPAIIIADVLADLAAAGIPFKPPVE